MIFDKIITVDSELDKIKMESVRLHHSAAIKAIIALDDFEKKDKVLTALQYSYEYISRCQATFELLWSEVFDYQSENEKLKERVIELSSRLEQKEEDFKTLKKIFDK